MPRTHVGRYIVYSRNFRLGARKNIKAAISRHDVSDIFNNIFFPLKKTFKYIIYNNIKISPNICRQNIASRIHFSEWKIKKFAFIITWPFIYNACVYITMLSL